MYKARSTNPLENLSKGAQEILAEFNEKGYFRFRYHFTQTDTVLAETYGQPKTHKKNTLLHPIITATNSPTGFVSKTSYKELSKIIPNPKSHINNTLELVQKLQKFKIPDDQVLVFLDITSLFTNISCDMVLDFLYRRFNIIHGKSKISFVDIIRAREFLFDINYFLFNGKYYKQIFGTLMGSLISPLFTNLVMEDLENDCLQKLWEVYN